MPRDDEGGTGSRHRHIVAAMKQARWIGSGTEVIRLHTTVVQGIASPDIPPAALGRHKRPWLRVVHGTLT